MLIWWIATSIENVFNENSSKSFFWTSGDALKHENNNHENDVANDNEAWRKK